MSQVDQLLTRYSRRRGRREELRQDAIGILIDVFMFRRMITPWLIRAGFLVFCLFADIATAVAIVEPLVNGKTSRETLPSKNSARETNAGERWNLPAASLGPSGLMLQPPRWLSQAVWEWIALIVIVCVVRVVCESMIVVFQINETLTDVRGRLEQQNGRVG